MDEGIALAIDGMLAHRIDGCGLRGGWMHARGMVLPVVACVRGLARGSRGSSVACNHPQDEDKWGDKGLDLSRYPRGHLARIGERSCRGLPQRGTKGDGN